MSVREIIAPPTVVADGAAPARWKWTGEELILLAELGLLPADRKFELLDGEIIQIMPVGPLHAAVVGLIARILEQVIGEAFHVRQEKPVRLSPHFDPLPDIAVVKGDLLDYAERFPGPEDVVLVVEVADTSLEYDRSTKMAAYSAAGIADYWIVNLRDQRIEVHGEPADGEYLARRVYRREESIAPLAAPQTSLSVAALLGRTQSGE